MWSSGLVKRGLGGACVSICVCTLSNLCARLCGCVSDRATYTGTHCDRKYQACRVRRKREGGLHLVILEQLLRPAFSVLLGENNSIKGTRSSIIIEWGDRRQLPAWLWNPFESLEELPHITHCSCWEHLGAMQNSAPTSPCRDRILDHPSVVFR